ncbi:hypothetical protein GLYMA_07G145800v4 [Glycine max]|nr:uncharacterized protein LOC100802123 [Glycine max]KAH1241997.1 hypothetical protein GmHk_07G019438 [Glycine max]KRH49290.2 hypothetical protein GLYMA_07G145800v4 [Glycine max]RZC02940.1 hypothetical protein D0Y65_017862 [Glycine soja]|eukprot:XP_003530257.2 uncharacterized protein LOC100802123 [Glycine max]
MSPSLFQITIMNRKQEAQNTYSQHIKFRPAASLFSPSSLYCFLTQAYTCLFCYVKMIALKSIHPFFTPIYIKYNIHRSRCLNTKDSVLCLCKSNQSESQAPQPGDIRKQELLAQIAMLQTQKVRLMDYFDERSEYLTQFGEEAKAEFDKIGEDALQGLDEASARITANIESQMVEFEESAELNRQEIQEREKELDKFEVQMEDGRNEGLFFKNLRKKAPVDKAKAKEEAEKIKDVAREKAGSRTRKGIYLLFIGLLTFAIVDSVASSSTDWRKIAVLGAILVALVSQFIYEQTMSIETGKIRKIDTEEENN